MSILNTVRAFLAVRSERNLSLNTWAQQTFGYLGYQYPVPLNQTLPGTRGEEKVAANFAGIVQGAAKSNGVVFACMLARQMLFQEARFLFREITDEGRPGKFYTHPNLAPLEHPWEGGTTGDLLARSIQMVDIAGSSFVTRRGEELVWLRPDWLTIVCGSRNEEASVWDLDARVIGYLYQEGGSAEGRDPVVLLPETVAAFTPIPDPVARWRGMSWIHTLIPEIEADNAATLHKRQFFANGATPNMVVHFDPSIVDSVEKFNAYVDAIEETHTGAANAYKTMYLTGATSAEVVGANMQQLDFKATQGAGETRIAAAAGVPPVIVGLSEGLQGSSLNAGNYDAAFQRFADLTIRPLWRNWCGSMETLIRPPKSNSPIRRSQLWYDDRDVPALRQDEHERAEIQKLQSEALASLIQGAGMTPQSAIDAVATGELSKLKHSGLPSVQLQPPGNGKPKLELPKDASALASE